MGSTGQVQKAVGGARCHVRGASIVAAAGANLGRLANRSPRGLHYPVRRYSCWYRRNAWPGRERLDHFARQPTVVRGQEEKKRWSLITPAWPFQFGKKAQKKPASDPFADYGPDQQRALASQLTGQNQPPSPTSVPATAGDRPLPVAPRAYPWPSPVDSHSGSAAFLPPGTGNASDRILADSRVATDRKSTNAGRSQQPGISCRSAAVSLSETASRPTAAGRYLVSQQHIDGPDGSTVSRQSLAGRDAVRTIIVPHCRDGELHRQRGTGVDGTAFANGPSFTLFRSQPAAEL